MVIIILGPENTHYGTFRFTFTHLVPLLTTIASAILSVPLKGSPLSGNSSVMAPFDSIYSIISATQSSLSSVH